MPTSVASDSNVLLQSWTTPYALPPFDQIEDHHFEEAFKYGLSELNTELNATLVIVTHSPVLAARCHRTVEVRAGRIVTNA